MYIKNVRDNYAWGKVKTKDRKSDKIKRKSVMFSEPTCLWL